MKTFGTLTLLALGALLIVAALAVGPLTIFLVLGLMVYGLIAASLVTGVVSLIGYLLAGSNTKSPIWVLLPALPFWSVTYLCFVTARYWFEVLAITQWEYYSKIEEDFLLREADAEFHEAVAALSFRPWVWL